MLGLFRLSLGCRQVCYPSGDAYKPRSPPPRAIVTFQQHFLNNPSAKGQAEEIAHFPP